MSLKGDQPKHTRVYAASCVVLVALLVLLGYAIRNYIVAEDLFQTTPLGLISRFEKLRVAYVAANKTSQEVFCKLCNVGNYVSSIEEIRVNGTEVTTSDIGTVVEPFWGYKTIALKYEGPWEGSILISVRTQAGEYNWPIDLRVASGNPIEQVYPSQSELQESFLRQHSEELVATSELEITVLVLGFLVLAVLLIFKYRLGIWTWQPWCSCSSGKNDE